MARILILASLSLLVYETETQGSFGFGFQRYRPQSAVNSFLGGFFGNPTQGDLPVYYDRPHSSTHHPTHHIHNHHPSQGEYRPTRQHIHFGTTFPPQNAASCHQNNGGCQHHCQVSRGHKQCYCDDGYNLGSDRVSCFDIDECDSPDSNLCSDVCINTPGSFNCACSGGAILQQDGLTCSIQRAPVAFPEGHISCQVNNGGCEQKCKDRIGRVKCKCHKGYQLARDQLSCLDINECANPGVCPGSCTNTQGAFTCGDSPGRISCEVNNGGCAHKCKNNRQGIMECKCRRDYTLATDGRSCSEGGSDRCARNNGGCQHNCLVENGLNICTCNLGYELVKDKKCRLIQGQVNPCIAVRCHHRCETVNGRAVCVCNPNYELVNGLCALTQPPINPYQSCSSKQTSLPPGCGSSRKNPTFTRIVGGRETNPEDWPWMVGLMRKSTNRTFCGGVLIKPQYVMSAAHCSVVYNANEIKLRLGEHDFSKSEDNCPEDHDVLKIIVNPQHNSNTNENDIAILQMVEPVRYNAYIQPVCLPLPSHNPVGKPGYVIGWGTTSFLGTSSNVLREAAVPVWDKKTCESSYTNRIYDGMMCVGSRDGKRDSCQGDSGGPFMQFSGTRWQVSGIVSWGEECATVNRPGVYTRVNRYLSWIASNSQ